jgi:IMP dehydrogenase
LDQRGPNMKQQLTYDDVILTPQYSDIESRWSINISSFLDDVYKLPVIAAPMDTVCGPEMCAALRGVGGLGVLHRYCSIEQQIEMVQQSKVKVAAAVGATGDYQERFHALYEAGVRVICIDVAHGHHVLVKRAIEYLKGLRSDLHIMTGNIATGGAYLDLATWGADSLRVGVGSGAACTTQVQTGHGAAALSAVLDAASVIKQLPNDRRPKIIADGGIRTSGDMVKALAAGADFVMLGSVLAGTSEAPGIVVDTPEGQKKAFRGMASKEAQENWRGRTSVAEGVSTFIDFKGSVVDILHEFEGGIRSGFSYSGAHDIRELRNKARFVQRSAASISEGRPHILHKG